MLWNNFYTNLASSNVIDSKKFWEFREFYSPGVFVFDRKGLAKKEISNAIQHMDIPQAVINAVINNDLSFLSYNSTRIVSIDALTQSNSIDDFLELHNYNYNSVDVVSHGTNYLLLKLEPKKFLLFFVVSESEMEKANGYFDYTEKDRQLVKDKHWLDISLITLD